MKNNKVDKENFEQYLLQARTWETDKVIEIQKSKKTAWIIASISSGLAILSVLAVASLVPLKEKEPFVIRVDNSTGIVDVVEALTDSKTNYDEVVNKYFTQWYVRYREGYTTELTEEYYYNVGVMSGGMEQQKYFDAFNPKNAQSPINVYGPYAKVKVRIKSTSFIKENVALVRYIKEIERGADKNQITHWAATITFTYSGAPMKEKDREINPLGFQVVEYRNDPDALTPDATTPAKAANTPAPVAVQSRVTVFPNQPSSGVVPSIRQE